MTERSTLYLDIDDDITAIIGKLRKATHPEVALVAPKRSNVLNSAVNLKLIKKSAHSAGKTPVLISDDSATRRLAGGLGMLVAPNLKAEPAVPTVPKASSERVPSDVIEGETMGGPAAAADTAARTYQPPSASGKQPKTDKAKVAGPSATAPTAAKPIQADKKSRVPDFNRFKKHLVLGAGVLIVFVLLLVSLFFWLPKATIAISGTTQRLGLDTQLTADTQAKNADLAQGLLPAKSESLDKTLSSTFSASGKKDLGTKASGTITIRNCDYGQGFSLSAGSKFTASNGRVFVSDSSIAVPGFSGPASSCSVSGSSAGKADVSVQAAEKGDSYNIGSQSYSFAYSAAKVDAVGTQMSGGSSKVATVVTQQDVDTAKNQLLEKERPAAKRELENRFNSEQFIIKDSLAEDVKSVTPSPGVDQEATTATLSLKVTYSETAVERKQLEELIKTEATKQAKQKDNKSLGVVDAGLDKATFKPLTKTATAQDFQLKTDVLLGPDINFDELKQRIGGKNFSDTVEIVRSYPNVTNVDVKFSPFYVKSVPKKATKIDVKIEVPR